MNEFTLTKAFIEFASKGDAVKIVDQAIQKVNELKKVTSSADFGALAKKYVEANLQQQKILDNVGKQLALEKQIASEKIKIQIENAKAEITKEKSEKDARNRNINKAGIAAGATMAATDAFIYSTVGQAAPVVMEQLNRAFNDLQAVIGQMLIPYVEGLTSKVRAFADWILNLDDGTKKMIADAIAATSAIATVGVALFALHKAAMVLGPALAMASAYLGPVGLAIAGIGLAAVLANRYAGGNKGMEFSKSVDVQSQAAADVAGKMLLSAEQGNRDKFFQDNPAKKEQLLAVQQAMALQLAGKAQPGSFAATPWQQLANMKAGLEREAANVTDAQREAIHKSSVGLSATANTAIMQPEELINRLQLEALKQNGPDVVAAEKTADNTGNALKELRDLNTKQQTVYEMMEKILDKQGLGRN